MSKPIAQSPPPDQRERQRALDPHRSILVQAPAGSGKTDLLTRRFLRLLCEVEQPGQIVAITFTIAAAAEMRHRILAELEKAADNFLPAPDADEFSMSALAHRALEHSRRQGWQLLDLPAQLRISTIDSFCRELALQQPLVSSLGGGLEIAEEPEELYRRAARESLRKIDQTDTPLGAAVEELLEWRDNGWQEMEELLVAMLKSRDRWMHGFVLQREPDWEDLRKRLERPFANAVRDALEKLSLLLGQVPGARTKALRLARFACAQSDGQLHRELAELAEFPSAPFSGNAGIEDAHQAHAALAALLLTNDDAFRKAVNKNLGFPPGSKKEKEEILTLIAALSAIPGLESALAAVRSLPPTRYAEDDWKIVRACFTLLRHAAGQLQIAFAEAGRVDFIEIAQIAQRVLRGEDGAPTDAALAASDTIRHLLVDEFQDTSRRQQQLLTSLIAAWTELDPARAGRTCFVVGDPMQSIYFFRDADAELFPRVKMLGLEIPSAEPLRLDFLPLTSNFRTAPTLVERLNRDFEKVFAADDGSDIAFFPAEAARKQAANTRPPFTLHLDFLPRLDRSDSSSPGAAQAGETARTRQIGEIIDLVRSHQDAMEQARPAGEKFRIAILGRAKKHLTPIAQALREAQIPFRAVELETLSARPEIRDALALARALHNPQDRVAWLGLLRAPWCGFALDDLHALAGGDPALLSRPVPELLAERLDLLSESARPAASRVLEVLTAAPALRAAQPAASLGTWLEQLWLRLGGADCVDATARANLNLLWNCLDWLPGGAADLLGPALDAALGKLTALPDPQASSDCGVQLMTIHKAKGLEFEVVIVPELQAAAARGSRRMLTWLERGIAEPDESEEITEFLIAPFQRKGEDRGRAKQWVDRVYRQREAQEMRRILYVAATRAREQLHLFARPACKEEAGSWTLAEPANSLLATAWPALEEEVRARFEEWNAARIAAAAGAAQQEMVRESDAGEIASIAASGESNLLLMPAPVRPTLLRRLPPDAQLPPSASSFAIASPDFRKGVTSFAADSGDRALYARYQGGLLSRALGTAVHALLDELSRLRANLDWPAARAALSDLQPRIQAQVRSAGIDPAQAEQIAAQALKLALSASLDPVGAWILSPHAKAASESAWAGVIAGAIRTVRPDRVFQAGAAPGTDGQDCWWIIDYKTAHADATDPAQSLHELRVRFAPQLEAYGQMLRNLRGAETPGLLMRAGLYYPRLLLLDWWEM